MLNQKITVSLLLLLSVFSLLSFSCQVRAEDSASLTLFDSNTQPVIVIDKKLQELLPETVSDLRRCLKKMTNSDIAICNRIPKSRPLIVIGKVPGAMEPGKVEMKKISRLGPEGFIIKTSPAGVLLYGATRLGTRNAVYLFLEKLGCRWFYPGEVWEEIPEKKSIILPVMTVAESPSFMMRLIWYGYGARANPDCGKDYKNWVRCNCQGGSLTGSIGHAYAAIARASRDYRRHPEWFPLIKGKRCQGGQLCLSNPEVQQRAIEYAENYFRRNPKSMMVSLSPNDGGGYCQCENCRKLGSVSDQTLNFANIVARALEKKFPDKYVAMYAYAGNSAPPNIHAHPRVIIFIATSFISCGMPLRKLIDAWSEKVSLIGIRDYYDVILWNHDMPRWQIDSMRKNIPYYYSKKARGISAESSNNWGAEGINYYVASKLMWDVTTDVDGLLQDYYRQCWHAAAQTMQQYFERWRGGTKMSARNLALAYRDLNRAAKEVENDPVALTRVNMMRLYLHWIVLYRKHNAALSSAERVKTAREAMHFSWKIAVTNMVHSYAHFRELRLWKIGRKTPKEEIERWKTSDQPPAKASLKAVKISLDSEEEDSLAETISDLERKQKNSIEKNRQALSRPKWYFTAAEIEKMAQNDVKSLPVPVKIKPCDNLRKLVPVTEVNLKIPSPMKKVRHPLFRGTNWFVIHSVAGKSVELKLLVGRGRKWQLKYALYHYPKKDDSAIRRGQVAMVRGETSRLTLAVPRPGSYLLLVQAGGNAMRLYSEKGNVCFYMGEHQTGHIFCGAGRMYFFVPKGTRYFSLGITTPDGFAAVSVGPGNGRLFSRRGNFVTGEELIVRVPPSLSDKGRIWNFSINKCEDATGLYLLGVPPLATPKAEQLLVPDQI